MADWIHGTVFAGRREPLDPGQIWVWLVNESSRPDVKLQVISVSREGEVHLRPTDPETAVNEFPPETWSRGKILHCPFKRVEQAKGDLLPGDFLCHEAWSCWENMRPYA
jgi:hypothetical protein